MVDIFYVILVEYIAGQVQSMHESVATIIPNRRRVYWNTQCVLRRFPMGQGACILITPAPRVPADQTDENIFRILAGLADRHFIFAVQIRAPFFRVHPTGQVILFCNFQQAFEFNAGDTRVYPLLTVHAGRDLHHGLIENTLDKFFDLLVLGLFLRPYIPCGVANTVYVNF